MGRKHGASADRARSKQAARRRRNRAAARAADKRAVAEVDRINPRPVTIPNGREQAEGER